MYGFCRALEMLLMLRVCASGSSAIDQSERVTREETHLEFQAPTGRDGRNGKGSSLDATRSADFVRFQWGLGTTFSSDLSNDLVESPKR